MPENELYPDPAIQGFVPPQGAAGLNALQRPVFDPGKDALMSGGYNAVSAPFREMGALLGGGMTEGEARDSVFHSALGMIVPGLGKGALVAMAGLPIAAKKAFSGAPLGKIELEHLTNYVKEGLATGQSIKDFAKSLFATARHLDVASQVDRDLSALGETSQWPKKVDLSGATQQNSKGISLSTGASSFPKEAFDVPALKKKPAMVGDIGELPRETQWELSPLAKSKGLNVPTHHGTRTPTLYDSFKLPEDEIGVHFGSPRAATEIQGAYLDHATAPRVYPVAIKAQKPLELPDLGTWEGDKVARALVDKAKLPREEVRTALYANGGADSAVVRAQNMRKYIESKGYDSIKYINSVEDPGHTSYILFKESPKAPGYVRDARVPWAHFKDMDAATLTSGIAGGFLALEAGEKLLRDQNGQLRKLTPVDHDPFKEGT